MVRIQPAPLRGAVAQPGRALNSRLPHSRDVSSRPPGRLVLLVDPLGSSPSPGQTSTGAGSDRYRWGMAPTPEEIVLHERPRAHQRCPYCHDALEEAGVGEEIPCNSCGTLHHEVCLEELGGCTVLGRVFESEWRASWRTSSALPRL